MTAITECVKQLVIQIIAVSKYDNGRIIQTQYHFTGIKNHAQAFAASLCMPNYAGSPVTCFCCCLLSCSYGLIHCIVLMIGCYFFECAVFALFKNDEMTINI